MAHLARLRRWKTATVTPLITTTAARIPAAVSSPEVLLPAGLGLMVGSELGPDWVGEGLGEGLGDAET